MTTSTSWDFHEGDEIAPGLTAMRLLGGGSSYEAYLAFDDLRYSPVVVKIVRPDQVDDPHTLRGLEREVDFHWDGSTTQRSCAAFTQPCRDLRPPAGGAGESRRPTAVESDPSRHGALPLQQLLPLAIELCSAVHYLGRLDLVHLDIKPSNVIMGAPASLIDLSVARSGRAAAGLRDPIGTDAYMSPEQAARAGARAAPASDIRDSRDPVPGGRLPSFRPRNERRRCHCRRPLWPQLVDWPAYELPGVGSSRRHQANPRLSQPRPEPSDQPLMELAELVAPVLSALPKPPLVRVSRPQAPPDPADLTGSRTGSPCREWL